MEPLGRPLWVTFDVPQSRSLLTDCDVEWVRFTAPRDWISVAANVRHARRIFRDYNVAEVVSTGSAIALSFMPLARAMGIPCHYVESAARSHGPSVTGRVLRRVPGMHLYCQYRAWASERWANAGSVFDEFVIDEPAEVDPEALDVVVMLGTLDYRFDRLIEQVRKVAKPGWNITWQLGPNAYDDLPGEVHGMVPLKDLSDYCKQADLVIAHAGVGSALTALEAGRQPVLVPRERAHGEHIDDHQPFVADELEGRGLARKFAPEELTTELLVEAARQRAVQLDRAAPVELRR
ncbi:MAG: hypothetical protein J7513_00385 [Solirubrobacteraceae bacterium]|nr:hypothetical protein [Solirubrobacteraceae bacterium]